MFAIHKYFSNYKIIKMGLMAHFFLKNKFVQLSFLGKKKLWLRMFLPSEALFTFEEFALVCVIKLSEFFHGRDLLGAA